MSDDASEREPDPVADDLDVGLRNRLRDARGGEMTRQELLELAEALTRQRQEIAKALADLARREDAAAGVRGELERTSREAAQALDERDARLSALAVELERERARLERRERELAAAAPPAPTHGIPEALEGVLADLRDRLDRVEAALAERVRTVPDTILGLAGSDERMARAVELVSELAHVLRHPLEAVRGTVEEAVVEPPLDAEVEPEPSPEPSPVAAAPPAAEPTVPGHVLFVATEAGYRVFERDGDAPAEGDQLAVDELGGADVRVTGWRSSPFPADRRRCLVCTIVAADG